MSRRILIQQQKNKRIEDYSIDYNQTEEKAYYSAYYLPVEDKANLQSVLNTYGSVRLGAGNFSGTAITITSGQKLYGRPNLSVVPAITIANGSSNVVIQNIRSSSINLQAGLEISNILIKSIEDTPITSVGGKLLGNKFINLSRCVLNWDMSTTGYFRNNTIVKHRVHNPGIGLTMKGNNTTPSYGNVQVWGTFMTSAGVGAVLDKIQDLRYIGLGAESWNWNNTTTLPLLNMSNMGDIWMSIINGGTDVANKTPVFDIQASKLLIANFTPYTNGGGNSILREGTDSILTFSSNFGDYAVSNKTTELELRVRFNKLPKVLLGTTEVLSPIIDSTILTKARNILLSTPKTPWIRPTFEPIFDVGNVLTTRVGAVDSTAYIQNLINTQGVADLPEGTYYISSSLVIGITQGLIGRGTAKTIIVGMTDTFPLLSYEATGSTETVFFGAHFSLVGGSTGIRIHCTNPANFMSVSRNVFKYINFRNQAICIHLDQFYGFDNNFFEYINFIDSAKGIYQEVNPSYVSGETPSMMFMDKNVFTNCQWINNDVCLDLDSKRASGGNMWLNCRFDNNRIIAKMPNQIDPIFANCDFTNNTGSPYLLGGTTYFSMYSCLFQGNITGVGNRTFNPYGVFLEGCDLQDNTQVTASGTSVYATNTKIAGSMSNSYNGYFINSTFAQDSVINKLIAVKENGTYRTIIDETPTPYPQLLVTQ